MKQFVLLIGLFFLLPGCTLVQTTRCAEITAWGVNANEPMLGIFANLGYVKYKRVAAPQDLKEKIDCPADFFGEAAEPSKK